MIDLYMYFIGGSVAGANIEVHDLQFVAVENPEDAFPILADRWFGEHTFLHVDVITKVTWGDGYDISLSPHPSEAEEKLFFMNMGGYFPNEIFERHLYEFVVAKNTDEAKNIARTRFMTDHFLPHRDALFDVDDCILLSELNGMHVHLTPNPNGKLDVPIYQGYRTIGGNRTEYDETIDDLVYLPS